MPQRGHGMRANADDTNEIYPRSEVAQIRHDRPRHAFGDAHRQGTFQSRRGHSPTNPDCENEKLLADALVVAQLSGYESRGSWGYRGRF
jgi:hypothetical protein